MMVSPTKALKMYKVSKPTLYQDMKTGKLSFTKNTKGRRQLNVAELERVYSKREEGTNDNETKSEQVSSENKAHEKPSALDQSKLLQTQIELLQEQMKFKDLMIEEWQEAFNKAQKTADKITALIEYKSEGQGDKQKIDKLEQTVNQLVEQNKELLQKENDRRTRVEARRKEQERLAKIKEEEEQRKGFFSRLFG